MLPVLKAFFAQLAGIDLRNRGKPTPICRDSRAAAKTLRSSLYRGYRREANPGMIQMGAFGAGGNRA